jgi:hypothetical protein
MKTQSRSTTRHIGAAGEVLVQYMLLKKGIDSARMTTDKGVDLVAYSPRTGRAVTIQVKCMEKPVLAGGKGKKALGWFLADDCPSELVAAADLEDNRVWLFTMAEFRAEAKQHSASGKRQLYMYVEKPLRTKHGKAMVSDYAPYLLENRIDELFGKPVASKASKRT